MSRRTWHTAAMAAILITAALVRLWNLDATEFKYDEARVANLAAQFVESGIPPLRGMGSSAGVDNPPLAVYLISLPVAITRDPLVVTGFVALLNVAGVWGCYALGRRYWGPGVGLIGAALLAVSPWAVFYSRKVWAQDLLLPFAILAFALLLAWAVDGRRWALSGALFGLAVLAQIHFAALALVPVFGVSILLTGLVRQPYRRPAWWAGPLLLGIGASLALYAPYVLADAQEGWRNVRALSQTLREPATWHWDALRYALLNVGGREIHALTGPQRFREFLAALPDQDYWPDRVEEGMVVLALGYLAVRVWRRRADSRQLLRDVILLLWLVGPATLLVRSRSPVYPHYLIPVYPAPYLTLGVATIDLLQATHLRLLRRAMYGLAGMLGATLVAWQVGLTLSVYAFIETHDTPGGMGTPIGVLRRVSATIRDHAATWSDGQVILYCPGSDPVLHECPAVFTFMAGSTTELRFVEQDSSLLFPERAADTLVVLAPGGSRAAETLTDYAQPLTSDTVWLRAHAGAYRFYRLPAGATPRIPVSPSGTPAALKNGVQLLGYGLHPAPAPGQEVRLTLYWHVSTVPQAPPEQGYRFANHLLARDGQRVGQHDGPGYPVGQWREGDTVASWFDISIAEDAIPGPYALRISMYVHTPPDQFLPVRVLGAEGTPVADAVEWATP